MSPRPAPPQKPKKSAGPLIGLIVAGVLAVVGLGGAGVLFSKQGGLTAENSTHHAAASAAAATLGIAIDTNAPIVWSDLWNNINTAITTLKSEGERQTVRLNEAEAEIASASEALQKAQSDATRSAQQATELNTRLTELQASSAAQLKLSEEKLKAAEEKLAEAQQALEAAEARLAAASEAEATPMAEASTGSADDAQKAPDSTTESSKGQAAPEPAAKKQPSKKQVYEFPGPRNEVLRSATYDAARQTLKIELVDGAEINYREVPASVYERLSGGLPTYEVFFRMKVMGVYPADVDDKAAVRALGKSR